ncbi:MAG: HIT domain-containing protein [Verrucomicrobiota bacterium]
MESLHAHWRMDYIATPRLAADRTRPFTALPALGNDRAALIVHRTPLCYLMLNRFPYNPGHLLAIPFREVVELDDLTATESADLMSTMMFAKQLLAAALRPDGFNLGFNLGSAAGGSITHLHAHIVPRWNGDTNFMPVLGSTRVLPQALDATWEKLSATAEKLKNHPRQSRKSITAKTRAKS